MSKNKPSEFDQAVSALVESERRAIIDVVCDIMKDADIPIQTRTRAAHALMDKMQVKK